MVHTLHVQSYLLVLHHGAHTTRAVISLSSASWCTHYTCSHISQFCIMVHTLHVQSYLLVLHHGAHTTRAVISLSSASWCTHYTCSHSSLMVLQQFCIMVHTLHVQSYLLVLHHGAHTTRAVISLSSASWCTHYTCSHIS